MTGTETGPPEPVPVPRAPFVALVLALVVGGVLGILVLNTKINENAFTLQELYRQQIELDLRQQQLEQEIAQASSTATLDAAARRMGLVDLRHELEYLYLPGTPATEGDES